ncbi:MAG: SurA N-terminal domain-containing protein [Alphaproteobacteria bacterium]
MLRAIREGTNSWLVRILLILIIASFALWGVQTGTIGGTSSVARVGDARVTQQEYSRLFNREFARLQNDREDPITVQDAIDEGLDQVILDRLVLSAALDQGAADLGLRVSDDRVRKTIAELPIFIDLDGNFDMLAYEQELRNADHSTSSFEREVRKDLSRADLIETLTGGVVTPTPMIEALYEYQFEGRTAEYFVVASANVTDIATPSDADLRAYYDAQINDYMRPEYRALTFLRLTPESVASQVEVTEAMIQEAYDDGYAGGETAATRKLNQIMVDSEEEARSLYESIANGADFMETATSAGLSSAEAALGDVERSAIEYLGEDAVNVAFSADRGTVTEPVETPLGWVIFDVQGAADAQVETLEDVREELVALVTEREAGYKIDDLVVLANEEITAGATIEDLAETLSLDVTTIPALNRDGLDRTGTVVEAAPASADFFESAFSRSVDEFIDLEDDGDNGYFIIRVDDIAESEPRPFDEVRDQVEADWIAAQRLDAAKVLAESLAAEVRAGTSMADAAEKAGAVLVRTPSPFYRTMQGRPGPFTQDMVNQLFAEEEGGVVDGVNAFENGHVIAKLADIRAASINRESPSYQSTQEILQRSLENDIFIQYEAYIYDEHSMSRNPALVSQMLTPQ